MLAVWISAVCLAILIFSSSRLDWASDSLAFSSETFVYRLFLFSVRLWSSDLSFYRATSRSTNSFFLLWISPFSSLSLYWALLRLVFYLVKSSYLSLFWLSKLTISDFSSPTLFVRLCRTVYILAFSTSIWFVLFRNVSISLISSFF